MPTTGTLFTPALKFFPFIGLGPAAQVITPIPSAEVTFSVISGAITVAAAGNDQSIIVNCDLPRSFCYVLAECSMRISSNDGDNWDQECFTDLQDSQSAPIDVIPVRMNNLELSHASSASFARTYVAEPPNKVIVPLGVDDGRLSIFLQNVTIDGAVGSLRFYARFLRFDRNQAQFWQVNTPVLIR